MTKQAVKKRSFLAKYPHKLTTCVAAITLFFSAQIANAYTLSMQENNLAEKSLVCSYVYEFNFHDPLIAQKSVRQAIKSMLSAYEISKNLGEPLHFVLPKPLYEQEQILFHGTVEHYLEEMENLSIPLHIRLYFSQSPLNERVAHRMSRMLSQSDLFRVSSKSHHTHFQLRQIDYCDNNPHTILQRFHSKNPLNQQGYTNPLVDKWLELLSKQFISEEEQAQLIRQIVSQLDSDIAVLPLFQYQRKMHADTN